MEAKLKRQKNIIDNNRTFLVENLDHEDVIDQLIQCDLVGQFAAQQLRLSDKSKQEKNRIIVDQLYSDGPGAVEKFCRILRNRKRQAYIADQLEGCKALLYFRFKEKESRHPSWVWPRLDIGLPAVQRIFSFFGLFQFHV